ncbi:hypothetical protein DL96DRAFT_272160 [Flagelloscypha sp. PMI_526]|nr:hypothetical protein DL96DRAFT_272160 [Flagelloscypha sp. PMI_526]
MWGHIIILICTTTNSRQTVCLCSGVYRRSSNLLVSASLAFPLWIGAGAVRRRFSRFRPRLLLSATWGSGDGGWWLIHREVLLPRRHRHWDQSRRHNRRRPSIDSCRVLRRGSVAARKMSAECRDSRREHGRMRRWEVHHGMVYGKGAVGD